MSEKLKPCGNCYHPECSDCYPRAQPEAVTNAGDVGKSRSVGDAVSFQAFNLASQLATAEADLAKAMEVIQEQDEVLKFYAPGNGWGQWLAWILNGAPSHGQGIDASKSIASQQLKVEAARTTARNYLEGNIPSQGSAERNLLRQIVKTFSVEGLSTAETNLLNEAKELLK